MTSTYDLLKTEYPPFITFPQAAQILCCHVSTLYKWLKENNEPVKSVDINGLRRVRLFDICAYLDNKQNKETESPKLCAAGRPRKVKNALELVR